MDLLDLQYSQWIWVDKNDSDSYADFYIPFRFNGKKTEMVLSCDGNYVAELNGDMIDFGQYPDLPHYKIAERKDITRFCKNGENILKVTVWYQGVASSNNFLSNPGFIYSVLEDGVVISKSGEDTLSRINPYYKNGYGKWITPQIGLSYLFDSTKAETEYGKSKVVTKEKCVAYRPVEKLVLGKLHKKDLPFSIFDLGDEKVGYIELDFYSDKEQVITFSYSEHLNKESDVQRHVAIRDFSFEYRAKKGRNVYKNMFLRLGLRYLKVESECPIYNGYVGIREVSYPFKNNPLPNLPAKYKNIYDICLNALKLCAHDHYEDNPWREQSMYVMDSRNQMLCGYYTFDNNDYQRANIVTISKSIRDDDLLSITAHTSKKMAIPLFSLCFIICVYEYIEHTGDKTVLDEVFEVLTRIIGEYLNRIDKNGLIPNFPYPYWNFFEWTEESNNETEIGRKNNDGYKTEYSLLLNSFFVLAMRYYEKLCGIRKIEFSFDYENFSSKVRERFNKNGRYVLNENTSLNSELGNGLVYLSGIDCDKKVVKDIAGSLCDVKVSLPMIGFVYDAMLKCNSGYKEYVLKDITEKYQYMIDKGATTCWETIKGAEDFLGAGSLCHGWSALPVYYFNLFFK